MKFAFDKFSVTKVLYIGALSLLVYVLVKTLCLLFLFSFGLLKPLETYLYSLSLYYIVLLHHCPWSILVRGFEHVYPATWILYVPVNSLDSLIQWLSFVGVFHILFFLFTSLYIHQSVSLLFFKLWFVLYLAFGTFNNFHLS